VSPDRDGRAPFERLADLLREEIAAGRRAPGERLPSGRALAMEHGVALATAQSALQRLRDEGLATASPRGYVVSDPEGAGEGDSLAEIKAQLAQLSKRVERLEQRSGR
jgi:DNA-binding transcriptional regulator YhcF (GntR family)